jgi:hypothetical protein
MPRARNEEIHALSRLMSAAGLEVVRSQSEQNI